jgi:hypothetical protein
MIEPFEIGNQGANRLRLHRLLLSCSSSKKNGLITSDFILKEAHQKRVEADTKLEVNLASYQFFPCIFLRQFWKKSLNARNFCFASAHALRTFDSTFIFYCRKQSFFFIGL